MTKVVTHAQVRTRDSAFRIQPALADLVRLVLVFVTMQGRMTMIPTRGLLAWILPIWLVIIGSTIAAYIL